MTREELQHLHDRYKQTGRYSHLLALANGVHRFLEQDDPTVEIAEAGRDQEARAKELRGAAEAYLATHLHGNSAWINREHVAQWLHDRADAIEGGSQ